MGSRIGLMAIGALLVAACGGSDDVGADEPDAVVDAVDSEVLREAGDDVQVINGCRIEFGTVCRGANLSGANLAGVNLGNALFPGANLSGANLEGANLSGTYLFNADLRGVNLWRADLQGAVLSGANLREADLRYAILVRADLDWADLAGADLWGAKYCRTRLPDMIRNDNCWE